ncbi:MAG TPA: hemolysin family protein, partial [bacterium]|nr:hemolysin family protein [bacterium]
VGKDDLRLILQAGQEEGEFTADEHEMITQVFDMGATRTRELMVPLIEAEVVAEDATVDEFLALARRTGFSRFPVYRERVDRIIGMITVYDVLFLAQPPATVAGLVRDVMFVPELKPADELLRDMQKQRAAAAVVVDEFGGAVGMVTMELILEEIVGDIHDEGDDPAIWHKQISDGVWVVDGSADINDLHDELGITLPKDGYATLAGLIMLQLGRIPRPGEKLVRNDFRLTVLSMDNQSIERVKIERIALISKQ